MINLVVAYDDNASELADYFEASYTYINNHIIQNAAITCHALRGLECTEANMDATINGFGNGKFGFVGFSHGNSEELVTDIDKYVSSTNCNLFCDCFFYSTACELADTLGQQLIDAGCNCFVGYWEISYATHDDFFDTYIECETFALKEFLSTDKTLGETYNEMLDFFEVKIEELYAANEVLVAMELSHNLEYLNIKGDENVRASDFQV